jgi:Fe2+ or Zn2+ uptake regulation protein
MIERINKSTDFKVDGQRIDIYGICDKCVKK